MSTICVRIALLASALFLAAGIAAPARADSNASSMFPFVIPWDDSTPNTATDVSFLNEKPAGVNGAIVVRDSHFVESKTGNRVRFLGVNFEFAADFPTHTDAEKIAAHLAKLGINIVRIHHEDAYWGRLWDKDATGGRRFSTDSVDRLDYLIAQLKKNGIYVDLNLHVSRQYTPEDGFPASVNSIPGTYDKRIDNIDDRMILLQKEFAHDYLTHVNPYTNISYAADPCVAVVEINNENSLVDWGPYDHMSFFEQLPEPFHGEVVAKWNAWLAKRYASNTAMLAAWTPESTATAYSGSALNASSTWSFEDHSGSGTLTRLGGGSTTSPVDVQITSPNKPDQPWKEQACLQSLDLTDGALYAVSFRAKADKQREIGLYAGVDQPDWRHVGLDAQTNVSTDWRFYHFIFKATKPAPHENRLVFVVGGDTGSVWLSNVTLGPATADSLLPDGQSLENRNVDIPVGGTPAQVADWVRFLEDTELAYADEMRGYLRHDLGVKANIVDTQVSFGLTSGIAREADSDFIDNHAYWQHPIFPHKPWDRGDWLIENTPQVDAFAGDAENALSKLALYRVAGKPYSISEYNLPAPSDFQAEMYPEYATFAAFQDWDMIYGFDYGQYGSNAPTDEIQTYFDNSPNPAKAAFLPTAALLFRTGAFAPASATTTLLLPPGALRESKPVEESWKLALGPAVDIFGSRMQVTSASGGGVIARRSGSDATASSIHVVKTAAGAEYIAIGGGAVAVTGYVGGQTVDVGPLTLQFPAFGDNFAAMTVVALDAKPLGQSRSLLLTIIGKAENVGMIWNADHTSVGRSWGHGPVQAEGIAANINLTNAIVKHVWALGPTGARVKEIPVTLSRGRAVFSIGPEDQTVWYEIVQ